MIRSLKLRSNWEPHPHSTKQLKWPRRPRGIWKHPIIFSIPVSSKETNTWLAWDLVLFRNTGNPHWGWQSHTPTTSCMAGANCGKQGLRRQSWPNRSCTDQPRVGYLVLQLAIVRRRTELGQGEGHCIHVVRSHCLGWQTNSTQCQTCKPGWWLAVDHPSNHWGTHQTKGAWPPSFHSISVIKTCPHDQPTSQQLLNDGRYPSLALNQDSRR